MEMADSLSILLKDIRDNSEFEFHELFINAQDLAEKLEEEIKIPRLANVIVKIINAIRQKVIIVQPCLFHSLSILYAS